VTPKGMTVRPTPDLVRQAVFNSLGTSIEGATVLDLFSGTGALGLECLSRGARQVLSVELSSKHARFIRDNARELGLAGAGHELRVQDVFPALRQLVETGRRFDFIMADPPFGPKTAGAPSRSFSQKLMDAAETVALLAVGGRLVLGHAKRDGVTPGPGWEELRVLTHGDSVFRILKTRSEPAAGAELKGNEAFPPEAGEPRPDAE
jgi:16S rRNA (guanine966-N2)-methyltransferase